MKEDQKEEIQEETQESIEDQESQVDTQESDFESKFNELEQKYLRVYADFENTKKRLEREKSQVLEYSYEGISRDLLPIIDTLHKAFDSAKEGKDSQAISEGIGLTLDNLMKVLKKHSIEEISTEGEFDPNFHDAIMQVACEQKENGQIVEVLQKGYKYKDRILRPAMVSIAKN